VEVALFGFGRRRKDEGDFAADVFCHVDGLYRYALRLCRDEGLAEDLVQETLLNAYKAFHRVREGSNHRAWVYTILRNAFFSKKRKEKRQPRTESSIDLDTIVVPYHRLKPDEAGFGDDVFQALRNLSEPQRTAVLLCDVEGFSYDEISVVLDCPVGTVRSRIHHARKRLRDELMAVQKDDVIPREVAR
jgi:RNA polymerase sigma factor (sigma-70 family)